MRIYISLAIFILTGCLFIACKGGFSGEGTCNQGDCKNGTGTYVYNDGLSAYKGQFKDGKRSGSGAFSGSCKFLTACLKGEEEIIECAGSWQDNLRHGSMKCAFKSGDIYEGDFQNDKRNGQGTYKWSGGDSISGQWKDDKIDGKGTMVWNSGSKYSGDYVAGSIEGTGVYNYPSGAKYEGQFKNGRQNGQGTKYYPGGRVEYRGEFMEGRFHGTGTLYDMNGKILFTGKWDKGIQLSSAKKAEGEMSDEEVEEWNKIFSK